MSKPPTLSDLLHLKHSVFTSVHEEACLALARTGEALVKRADRLLAPHSLTAPQFNLLMVLKYEAKGGLSQVALGKRLLLSRANMSVHVKRLAARGLLRKAHAPGSAREHRITLSPAAQRLLPEVEPKYNREVASAMGVLSAADCRRLCAVLAKLWSHWKA